MNPPGALFVLTRDPSGFASGRIGVLRTAMDSLESQGCRVEVAVFGRRPPNDVWSGRRMHHLPLPRLGRVVRNTAATLMLRRASLNEALFDSPRARRRLKELTDELSPAVVVADGLRTAAVALSTECATVVHLDDLLSDRYSSMIDSVHNAEEILGFYATQIPARLRPLSVFAAKRLLATEAVRVRRREVNIAQTADAVAMTSGAEASELARRSGVVVAALPMAVRARRPVSVESTPPSSFVFLGSLSYGPNRVAIEWWVDEVCSALDSAGGADVNLSVIGDQPAGIVESLSSHRLKFVGYVDDLAVELSRYRGMVVPVTVGAGVKTKVLDGFSVGLPVVATTAGASGTQADPGVHYLHADDPAAFARAVLALRDDADLASSVGAAGRGLLVDQWSPNVIAERWDSLMRGVIPH